MPRTIWKFGIPLEDRFTLDLPRDAEILHIDVQRGAPFMWVVLDPDRQDRDEWRFVVIGTGHQLPESNWLHFVGSFLLNNGEFVFHVFHEVAA